MNEIDEEGKNEGIREGWREKKGREKGKNGVKGIEAKKSNRISLTQLPLKTNQCW